MTNIKDFVKKGISFEEKVELISCWEEDRGSDGEFVYDLDNEDYAWCWSRVYNLATLYKCRNVGRYWLGGRNFTCNGCNLEQICVAQCMDEEWMEVHFESFLLEIEDRFEDWVKSYGNPIEEFNKIYDNLIDFEGYYQSVIGKNTKYKWVAFSNDGSFHNESNRVFESKEDAYNDMRNSALEKVKWNTEYEDVLEMDDSYIGYSIRFYKDRITHDSYSGHYNYYIEEVKEGN